MKRASCPTRCHMSSNIHGLATRTGLKVQSFFLESSGSAADGLAALGAGNRPNCPKSILVFFIVFHFFCHCFMFFHFFIFFVFLFFGFHCFANFFEGVKWRQISFVFSPSFVA